MPDQDFGDREQEKFNKYIGEFIANKDLLLKLEGKRDALRDRILQGLEATDLTDDQMREEVNKMQQTKVDLLRHRHMLKELMESDKVKQLQDEVATLQSDQGFKQLDRFIIICQELIPFIEAIKNNVNNKSFLSTYKSIVDAKTRFADICNGDDLADYLKEKPGLVKDYHFLKDRLNLLLDTQRESFLCELTQLFKRNIVVSEDASDVLSISCSFLNNITLEQFDEFVQCVLAEKELFKPCFAYCFETINKGIVKQILVDNTKVTSLVVDSEGQGRRLVLDGDKSSDVQSSFDNLKVFIGQVIDLFTCDTQSSHSADYIAYLGHVWVDSLLKSVVLYYYDPRVPSVEADLEHFLADAQTGEELLDFLVSSQLIGSRDQSKVFADYFAGIRQNFSAKLSQSLLVRMKQILSTPLDDTIPSTTVLANWNANANHNFAVCQVSSFMLQVKDLFEQASQQLTASSTNTKLMLAETFQDMCEVFMNITPNLFRAQIETNSHANAVFYCNTLLCAYLVECLVARHRPLLDSLTASVPELQHLGSQTFINQLKFQENFILFFLRNETFRVSLQTIAEEIPSTDLKVTSKSHYNFRQCLNNSLKNLFALHRAFEGVLPQKIYVKTFTTLINSLLGEFTGAILALDDISSLAASHLSHELDYLSKELKMYVEHSQQITAKWLKLNEINYVLKSSLLEIVNRWADGKGLLAHYLTADEVKHLIQALFQNNDRRANALAKIRD